MSCLALRDESAVTYALCGAPDKPATGRAVVRHIHGVHHIHGAPAAVDVHLVRHALADAGIVGQQTRAEGLAVAFGGSLDLGMRTHLPAHRVPGQVAAHSVRA
jgi:hypothetical protein